MPLPPCGLYRTTIAIGSIEAGRLVYFHNHGDPGPGIYLPTEWRTNRARFGDRGVPLAEPGLAQTLEPLPAEGLYRVAEAFVCCSRGCRTFEVGLMVQLGYNGVGDSLLFLPHWHAEGLHFPDKGFKIERDAIGKLQPLALDSPERRPTADSLQ